MLPPPMPHCLGQNPAASCVAFKKTLRILATAVFTLDPAFCNSKSNQSYHGAIESCGPQSVLFCDQAPATLFFRDVICK